METQEVIFDSNSIPPSFVVCFNSGCPKAEECLRRLAGDHLPQKRKFGPAIYPTMEVGDNGCRLFMTGKTKLMAWGFAKLFEDVKIKDGTKLRDAMKTYLGGRSNYYRYNSGEHRLTPEQQTWILHLFHKKGYDGLEFEHYVHAYDFDH